MSKQTRGEEHVFEVADYTARVIPHCDGVAVPLEDARILWQR